MAQAQVFIVCTFTITTIRQMFILVGSDVTIANGLILEKTDSLEIQVPAGDAVWIVVGSGLHI
jgi:hypothetical protein